MIIDFIDTSLEEIPLSKPYSIAYKTTSSIKNLLATILQKRGFKVTGSDLVITDELKELKKLGAKVQIGHEPRLVKNANLVVASSAISKRNPELSYAKKSGLTIIPRAEMLGTLMKPYRSIAIAGSHGKTSTTSIVASIFNAANLSPTYVIGGQVLSVELLL